MVTLARNAMATRFELVLYGEDPVALRAAGEEALAEIERLEAQLSLFRPASEIAHLNARAAREPVRVSPEVFRLLEQAQTLSRDTSGAFDITIAPLVRGWGFMGGSGHEPLCGELEAARAVVGIDLLRLDASNYTVSFARPGVMLDLGAIGKGYAIDRAIELLREAGVNSALLHGGTSTVYGLGRPPGTGEWQVAIENARGPRATTRISPQAQMGSASVDEVAASSATNDCLAIVPLRNAALSVSAVWGKAFVAGNQLLGHVLDPRTGRPTATALLAAVALPSAMETDALSTALLVLGAAGHGCLARARPGIRTLVAGENQGALQVHSQGIVLLR